MQWVPTPTYLCRKWLAFNILAKLSPLGDFLEIGFGAGDFLFELGRRGFSGKGIDMSEQAVTQVRDRLTDGANKIRVFREDFFELQDSVRDNFCLRSFRALRRRRSSFGQNARSAGPGRIFDHFGSRARETRETLGAKRRVGGTCEAL